MPEASPICPACVKGEEGEAEVGVGEEGERLTSCPTWPRATNTQTCPMPACQQCQDLRWQVKEQEGREESEPEEVPGGGSEV